MGISFLLPHIYIRFNKSKLWVDYFDAFITFTFEFGMIFNKRVRDRDEIPFATNLNFEIFRAHSITSKAKSILQSTQEKFNLKP